VSRAPLLLAIALAGCDRAPVTTENVTEATVDARAAAIANEAAWVEQMRAETERNAALAAELDELRRVEDPFANFGLPVPAATEPADIATPRPRPAPPPSDADLRAAEAAVRTAMEQRRARGQ
jgi:hypothetical protein